MTQKTANSITTGARVRHTHDGIDGTVFAVEYAYFMVRWDDGAEQRVWKTCTGVIELVPAVAA